MSDQESGYEDLERTDVLPNLAQRSEEDANIDRGRLAPPAKLTNPAAAVGKPAHMDTGRERVTTLPAKPSTTDLALGGIRGKIADLEGRLIEAQDRQIGLKHQCEQLAQRCSTAEERAAKAEAKYVQQSAELHRATQHTTEAQQRLQEERVRFQAKTAETERRLIDARTHGEKRIASLERLLGEQTERATHGEHNAAETRLEIEKSRAEFNVAQFAIRSLEKRLAEQTQAAADITQLYSEQTSQIAANSDLMAEMEQHLTDARAARAESDERISHLETEIHSANESAATLQAEIAMKQRHIAAIESGLDCRDRSIETLKAQLDTNESAVAELTEAKATLEQRRTELERAVADARTDAANAQQEIERLTTALRGNDVRINDLAAALRTAERGLQEREATIKEAAARADATQSEYAQLVAREDALRRGLDEKEQQLDQLQKQLAIKVDELHTAHESARTSQAQQAHSKTLIDKLETDVNELQQALEKVMAERNQLDMERRSDHAALSDVRARFEDALQTLMAARESIGLRDQKIASLEHELHTAARRLEQANTRIERAAAAAEEFNSELHRRDNRIATLEQMCAEHASALSAINQDIERVTSANPSERLAAMGYALESLDTIGTIHRINRTTTSVGRAATNDIAIDSTSVSRYHARIVVQPEGVWLIDLQSTNGCRVNGRPISRQILCDGDTVAIGQSNFRFSVGEAAQEERSHDETFPLFDEPLLIPAPRGIDRSKPDRQHH